MNTVKRLGFWAFILGIVFALLPVLSVLLATLLATLAGGCEVNEGGAQACSLLGLDIGELLYTLFVSGWFALVTIPLGGLAAAAGAVLYIVAKVVLWRRSKAAPAAQQPPQQGMEM